MMLMIKRAIFAILIIVNCIVIFNFSAQNSEKSTESSDVIVNKVVNTISHVRKKTKKDTLKKTVTVVVRKLAHFSIYALLGVWEMLLLNTFNLSVKQKILMCVIFGGLYALSDEIHQNYVGGRSPEVRDVCIDTLGIFCGGMLGVAINKVFKFKK